jgi:hypothetical protein
VGFSFIPDAVYFSRVAGNFIRSVSPVLQLFKVCVVVFRLLYEVHSILKISFLICFKIYIAKTWDLKPTEALRNLYIFLRVLVFDKSYLIGPIV